MFDVGFSELLLLAIVALVVLGPEKLPHAARVAGAWVGRIRRTISTMQTEIEREVAAEEVRSQLAKQFSAMGGHNFVTGLQEERRELESSLEAAGAALQDTPAPGLTMAPLTIAPLVITPQPDSPPPAATGAPVLPEAATPPDEVALDGEQAYREWLEAQRPNRIAPPASAPAADKDHKDASA